MPLAIIAALPAAVKGVFVSCSKDKLPTPVLATVLAYLALSAALIPEVLSWPPLCAYFAATAS
jgi:hypothetical protein